jgi:hypothetical protein
MDPMKFVPVYPPIPTDPADKARLSEELHKQASWVKDDDPQAAAQLSTLAANMVRPPVLTQPEIDRLLATKKTTEKAAAAAWKAAGIPI